MCIIQAHLFFMSFPIHFIHFSSISPFPTRKLRDLSKKKTESFAISKITSIFAPLERQIVVLNVVGSSPICHPQEKRKIGNGSPLFCYIPADYGRNIQKGDGK